MGYPPEPWETVRYGNVEYTHKDHVTIDHCADGTVIDDIDRVLAERICACVNFCRGMSNEKLAQYASDAAPAARWAEQMMKMYFAAMKGVIQ